MSASIPVIEAPAPAEAGSSVQEFLRLLGGPVWINVPGRDRSRLRVVTTLLHGNEPSGVRALHARICDGWIPSVDLFCFVGAVEAALAPPGFANRSLPGRRDLNRCFRPPFDGAEGRVAFELLERLRSLRPEALIDLHNTSGAGPAYGVTTRDDRTRRYLTALFSDRLIVTDLRLGALMEAVEDDFPVVTIECGGARDPRSDVVALEGLSRFGEATALFSTSSGAGEVDVLFHPRRVELAEGVQLLYAPERVSGIDLTLRDDLDFATFGLVPAGTFLGWLGPAGLAAVTARDPMGREIREDFFENRDGRLVTIRSLRLLMVTTDPRIARSDCLFYVSDDPTAMAIGKP